MRLGALAGLLGRRGRERAVLAALLAVLLGSLVLYVHSAYGHGDVSLYHRYAQAFWLGSPRLRSLPAEYPPLSLAPFTLTLIPPLPDWVSVFALWMLALFLAGFAAIRRRESARAAEVAGVYLVLAGFGTLLGRFDLVPAAATVVAYWAATERRFDLAYALLAAGTLLKLYPAALLPVVALQQYRALEVAPLRRVPPTTLDSDSRGGIRLRQAPPAAVLRGVGLFAGVVAAGFAVSAALDPGGWLGPLAYNARRPLQVESVPATLLWLGGLAGLPAVPDHSFHSYNLVGPLQGPLSAGADLALIGGCLWTYRQQLAGRLGFGPALATCLIVLVCCGRVLSPQYLIWVLPMVAIAAGEYDPAWLAVCALTTAIFPFAYLAAGLVGPGAPAAYPFAFGALIALRNALLVTAAYRFVRRSLDAQGAAAGRERPAATAA